MKFATSKEDLLKVKQAIIDALDSDGNDDPFYLLNTDRIVEQYQEWIKYLPNVTPYYAMKCNSQEIIVRSLVNLGCGLDVATQGEMQLAIELGVPPSRLIYSNTCKAISNLRYAKKIGVNMTVFDSESELHKIRTHYPTIKLLVRLAFDDPNAKIPMSQRFGCSLIEAKRLTDLACNLGLEVVGVHFHVGCGCTDPKIYEKAVEEAKKLFVYSEERGVRFTILNIGGGFPGSLGPTNVPFCEFAIAISGALQEHFPPSTGVEVVAEPGQYFVTTAQSVFVNIIGIKQNPTTGHVTYILSDGMHGSFRDVVTFNLVPDISVPPWYAFKDDSRFPCDLWGPTCDPMDRISQRCLLPKMQVGQWLEFRRMGAYTNELFCNFNGIPKPDFYSVGDVLDVLSSIPSPQPRHMVVDAKTYIQSEAS